VNLLSSSDLLITAVGVIVRGKRLWVNESPQARLELPGYIAAKGEKAMTHLHKFLSELELQDLPQETLYLTAVTIDQKPKQKATAVVRIIRFAKKPDLELPHHRFVLIEELIEDEQASSLTKAIAHWLLLAN
jgi:hypothetical protein